jgi:hypothetical protein
MLRTMMWLAAALLVLGFAGELLAQDAWPAYSTGLPGQHDIARGSGFYLSIGKLVALIVVAWAWVKSADWVSRDSVELGEAIRMPARVWNPVMVFSFLVAFLLAITIPVFAAGFGLLALAYVGPFATYVLLRNGRVTDDQKVFTPGHLKNWLANLGKREPKARVAKHPWQMGPEVEITAIGPLQMENQQALIEARQSTAYISAKYLIADALTQRADKIMLEFTANAVEARYQIDNVWHNAAPKLHEKRPLDRHLGDAILAVLKRVCHLNVQERRARQEGKTKIEFSGNKYDTTVQSQGTQTGERVVISSTHYQTRSIAGRAWNARQAPRAARRADRPRPSRPGRVRVAAG